MGRHLRGERDDPAQRCAGLPGTGWEGVALCCIWVVLGREEGVMHGVSGKEEVSCHLNVPKRVDLCTEQFRGERSGSIAGMAERKRKEEHANVPAEPLENCILCVLEKRI